jgi:hypothetical protein
LHAVATRTTTVHGLLLADQDDDAEPLFLYDDLTEAQERLLTLLGVDPQNYGR